MFQLLVSFGAPLFLENSGKETPCDCAEKAGHAQIALYLESKMVFSVLCHLSLFHLTVLLQTVVTVLEMAILFNNSYITLVKRENA